MSRLATLEGRNPAAGWRLVAWVLIALLAGMAVPRSDRRTLRR